MKYVLLIYSNPETWRHPSYKYISEAKSAEKLAEMQAKSDELTRQFEATGELLYAEPLATPSRAKLGRTKGGTPVVTDGPFLESKEQLAGYFVIDVATPERAYEIAALFPETEYSPIEVRPISGPEDMDDE
ncbi:MAG TPA: YciI family protein [Thermomicrobiales bacterium]|nr:YciI family protein [Thermomicrobiales bacterium]